MKKRILLATIATAVSAFAVAGFIGCTDDPPPEEPPPQAVRLDAPVITLTDNVVEWDAVDHAVSYSVYVGADDAVSVTTTSYTVDKTEPAQYEIYVVANASSSGDHTDSVGSNKVTYEVFSPEEVALVKLRLVNNPTKVDYFLDEVGGAQLDLAGLSVNAVYSNGDVKKVTPEVGRIDLSTAGDKTVGLSYTEDGRTANTSFVVTVRRRTEADIQNLVTLKHEFTAAGNYKVADGTVTAVDMDGVAVPVTVEGGQSKIAFQKSGVKLVKVTNGAGDVSFVKVCAAYYITSATEFLTMNAAPDGYYLLRNDITFEGYNPTIGTAPIRAASAGEFADERAFTYDESGTAQEGKAFTGTFDGDGYVITGYRHSDDTYSAPSCYYLGMFGYIGEGGRVCNFVLRNARIDGGKCCAIIAGVNLGTIENVTIEDDCILNAFYNGGALAAAYNGGTIRNIVCAPERFGSNWGGGAFVSAYDSADGAVSRNVYINNKTNLASILGNGWYYVDGVGTVYCNETYKKVLSVQPTMYKGQAGKITVFQRTVDELVFTTWVGGVATEGVLSYSSYDAEEYTYNLTLLKSAPLVTGDTFTVAVKPLGTDYLNNAVEVTVGAPYVIGASYEGQPIEVTAGTNINLQSISLKTVYTDDSEGTMHPISYEGYNKAGAVGVAQSVKMFFGMGADDYVTVSVTPKQAEGRVVTGISAQRKDASARITTDIDGTPDFDSYFTFTVTYSEGEPSTATVASGDVSVDGWVYGHNAAATVSYSGGIVSDTIEIDVWAVIKSVSDWQKINDNLSGYYMLEAGSDPFNFAHAAPRIGSVPTRVVSDETQIDTSDALEANAFKGKFDGNGRTLTNWGGAVSEYYYWSGGAYFGYAMFSYIGVDGEVANFTLDNCLVQGFNQIGIVSCFNKGTIKNVTVNANCAIDTRWPDLGVYASINSGTITGCTNNGATYTTCNPEGVKVDPAQANDVGSGNAPVGE